MRAMGRDGWGVVYEAVHEALCQRVVLKALSQRATDDPKDEEHMERFRREAVAIGRLQLPGLVKIHGYHRRDDGLSSIAMEFLDRESLAARLEKLRAGGTRVPRSRVVELGR